LVTAGADILAYKNGVVSVTTSPTLIATPSSALDIDGILIQNLGAVTLYLGGSTVTANTASTGGYTVAASVSVLVPTTGASATTETSRAPGPRSWRAGSGPGWSWCCPAFTNITAALVAHR
jgi:hypothetical protein